MPGAVQLTPELLLLLPTPWIGANNPIPGLRKTLTDSGFAARLRAPALRSRGLRSRGPSEAGERAKAPLKLFEINYGAQTRNARPGLGGRLGGPPKTATFGVWSSIDTMSIKVPMLQWRDLPPAPPRKKKSGRGAQNPAPNGHGEGASGAFCDHEHTKIGGTFCIFSVAF